MTDRRKEIDLLVEHFWKKGYLTLSRKFGTYLPEPSDIGGFQVDIIARQKNNYAIGITLNRDDLNDNTLLNRLIYLATRQTRNTNKKVSLFVGVNKADYSIVKSYLNQIDEDIRKNIRLFLIEERPTSFPPRKKEQILFS
ncbi:MAG TPA: hypothetical protein VK870_08100 [Ignavibacteriaceae bacterium]|nr:hypothetical protein [Ignavibacteriaceae bacterium]